MAATKVEIAALRLLFAAWHEAILDIRANFDPNQPRVPAGSGPTSGQWRNGGASRPQSDERPRLIIDIPGRPDDGATGKGPRVRPSLRIPPVAAPSPEESPYEPLPVVPSSEPERRSERIRVARAVAQFVVDAALRGATGPLGLLLNVVRGAVWLYEYYPLIESYFDPPKNLEDLIRDASLGPSRGYDIHHIVEQRPAELDGFPRSLIDGPGNLVRIPRMRHWEVNSWLETPNRNFDGLTPRQYVRGRDWNERYEVGLTALRETGVLVP